MAFNVQQINPLDLQPSVGIGVALPFSSDTVFTTTYTTKDALKTNLINYILTNPGERYLNPTFGLGITELLFEQSTEDLEEQAKAKIQQGIGQYFPQIKINTLQVDSNPDANTLAIYMKYSVIATNIEDQILVNIQT